MRRDHPQVGAGSGCVQAGCIGSLSQGRRQGRRKARKARCLHIDVGDGIEAADPAGEPGGDPPCAGESGDAGQHGGEGDAPPDRAELARHHGLELQPVEAGQCAAGYDQMGRGPPEPDGGCVDCRALNDMDRRLVESVGGAGAFEEILQPWMITLGERAGPQGPESRPRRPPVQQHRDQQAPGRGRCSRNQRRRARHGEGSPNDDGDGERRRRDEGCGRVLQGRSTVDRGGSGLPPPCETYRELARLVDTAIRS